LSASPPAEVPPVALGDGHTDRVAREDAGASAGCPTSPLAPAPVFEPPVAGVLTDIDDTLTTDGAITSDALGALHALAAAGVPVVAVTGRPVGWSERFVAGPEAWPVSAIVAENGAVALLPDPRAPHGFAKRYRQDAATRAANFERLQAVLARIESEIPGARRSTDSPGRETDIAIDHSEFTRLAPASIDRVVALMREAGLTATVSSIHVNGWLGDHDKPSGAQWIVRELWGRDLWDERARWVFVGDSSNDEGMFAAFPQSVGVANIARFWPRLRHRPRWVTRGERGVGFAEVAGALLAARG
jgi:HAD superfamily hydrolase (TIGR01484 family)